MPSPGGATFRAYFDHYMGRLIVVAVGELDLSTSRGFEELLREGEGDSSGTIIIDLRELTFVDSTGLHVLVRARSRAVDAGRRLVLVRGPESVRRSLEITNLAQLFEWAEDPTLPDFVPRKPQEPRS